MASSFFRPPSMLRYSLYALFLGLTASVCAEALLGKDIGQLSLDEIEENLQKCAFVQNLAEHKIRTSPSQKSWTSQLFAVLFPSSSPAINSLLATAYISGPPNFLLALCPPNIDPSSLSVMVAFAVGGLLGDTLFHLLPEIFLGEDHPDRVKFVMLEPNRNLLLGVGIIVGLVTFMAMDKALRIATGGDGGHSHGDSHEHSSSSAASSNGSASTSGSSSTPSKSNGELRKRNDKSPKGEKETTPKPQQQQTQADPINPSVKLAGLLNLIADFTHNITDGLALSSSFYASPALGATTTMAVFFHEIPHEVGDFALLIQSGFSKRKAMGAQFVTAVGAFLGTCIGIFVQEYGGNSASAAADLAAGAAPKGIWGTSLQWGDMLLPFTAGTFLYVGTVAVIPELLDTGSDKGAELKKTALQFGAMFVGAAIMLGISWS
ncbi:hypothetical protein PV08_06257 [Exophiala spinifera]|uniref:Major histocompatibility complex, class I n=1 Tax=Exophiala spinifera TaxID=91928 RepID=A0A0D1YME9_9EURO|nr:uncharacterized protein PV08_06257 [Exophiala spinifera]KIW16206.1 hypothetical protein PV08_06257 [Exophiala spinifera]